MIVKDIIKLAASILGREDLYEYLSSGASDNPDGDKREIALLERCFNLVENEIALEYYPLYYTDTIFTDDGNIGFDSLSHSVLEIIKVFDECGNERKFRLSNNGLKTKPQMVKVFYTYIPSTKNIDSESDFTNTKISERLLAYGIATEFCLIGGMHDEATLWDARYKDALLSARQKKAKGVMHVRSWR